jgi:hypothetical protein
MSGSTSKYLRSLISFQENPIMRRIYRRIKKRYNKLPHNEKHLIKTYINL